VWTDQTTRFGATSFNTGHRSSARKGRRVVLRTTLGCVQCLPLSSCDDIAAAGTLQWTFAMHSSSSCFTSFPRLFSCSAGLFFGHHPHHHRNLGMVLLQCSHRHPASPTFIVYSPVLPAFFFGHHPHHHRQRPETSWHTPSYHHNMDEW